MRLSYSGPVPDWRCATLSSAHASLDRFYLLDTSTANTIACSIVQTGLDNCNSLFYGISERNLDQLQRFQNSLARVVCSAARRDNVGVLRNNLHWLPVRMRTDYKVATLAHLALVNRSPCYIQDLVKQHILARDLRSSHTGPLLLAPRAKLSNEFASLHKQDYPHTKHI